MVTRRPLVVQNGFIAELPLGDTVTAGSTATEVATSSGIAGGGSVSDNPTLSVSLTPEPSGLLLTENGLAIDGYSLVTANTALASGSAAAFVATEALASGNAALSTAVSALASGNAALENLPTGGGSPVLYTTANSDLTAGDPVGLDDTGGVQLVRKIFENSLKGLTKSSPQTVATTYQGYLNVVSLNSSTFVLGYGGASGYPTALVATVTGTTVTYGSPVAVASTNSFTYELIYAGSGKVVFIYPLVSSSYSSYAAVGTVTGTSISFGTPVSYGYSNNSYPHGGVYDPVQNKVVVFSTYNALGQRYGRVGTISGSSISFGANAMISQYWQSNYGLMVYNSNQSRVLFIFQVISAPIIAVTFMAPSGTSLTVYNTFTLRIEDTNISDFNGMWSVYCTIPNKTLILYKLGSELYGVLFSLSGATGSFGTPFLIERFNFSHLSLVYDDTTGDARVNYQSNSPSVSPTYQLSRVISISGDSVSLGPITYLTDYATQGAETAYDTNLGGYLTVTSSGNAGFQSYVYTASGSAVYIQPTLSGYNNFIGTAASSVSSGDIVRVDLTGSLINRPTADLTTNSVYYVNPEASGFTTASGSDVSWNPLDSWKKVAKAVSSSGLLLLDTV
jgi:hypothetical protein